MGNGSNKLQFQYQNQSKSITKYLFLIHPLQFSIDLINMSRKSTQRHSDQSINSYQLHTNKKQRFIEQSSQDINNTGYGILPITQRKQQIYQLGATLHMDKKTTPLKYQSTAIKQPHNPRDHPSSDTIKYRQTLQKLDQTQQRLVMSDKKYGQLWRKYQAACQSIKSLNKQLSRAEEKPFDLQVRCNLLQKERDEMREKLRLREVESERARDASSNASGKLHKLQHQLEQAQVLINKLREECAHKSQTIHKLQEQLTINKQSQNRSYQRIISTLKQQIQLLHSQLTLKTQQMSTLSRSIYSNNLQQNKQHSMTSVSSLHLELSKLHKEKLNLVAIYEQKIGSMQQGYKFDSQRLKSEIKELSDKLVAINVDNQLKLEERQGQLIHQIKKLKETNQLLRKDNDQLINHVDNLQLTKDYLENQLKHFVQQNQKAMHQLGVSTKDRQQLKHLYHELQSIKKQFALLNHQLHQKENNLHQAHTHKQQLTRQIQKLQLQAKAYQNLQLQYDRRVKSANDLMLDKIQLAQSQRQQMQRQLLGQRLQTIKLKQQLQDQRVNLRKQYQLSLSNVKAQLSQRIGMIKEEKNTQTIEKEKIYAQMKDLQRKYELLASQMLTVNDMMNIATKVHKRYSHFVKK